MSHPLYIAVIWHQHQPMYKSALTGQYLMPWVRLHGTKDYLDIALILERFPKLNQTINLVPSLIRQIEEYGAGKARDPWLDCLLTPVLNHEQKLFVVQRFFDAQWERMVYPYPRYRQLLNQRQDRGISWCVEHWEEQDFGDLMGWHTLCWFDPLFQEEDRQIRGWIAKARGFTHEDRKQMYQKQREILNRIIPKHRELQEQGRLEITTTPYTHPILPLLADSRAAKVASPQMRLPEPAFRWAEDIDVHLTKAQELYKRCFGQAAQGLWPSEQSVSPQMVLPVVHQGFQWMVSDEGVLGRTLGLNWHRDNYGHVQQADQLYQPYRLTTPEGDITMIFRDRRLADLIGFRYSDRDSKEAARDLMAQLEAIQARLAAQGVGDQPHLVTIALDGENCWEYYEQDGLPFLQHWYEMMSDHPSLRMVTVSEYLNQFPPTQTIPAEKLHSGSWINSDFGIWIGDPIKNRAWNLLREARQLLADHPHPSPEAYEALWAAEGSDWFWWFGKPHSSQHDELFDQLFREHLQAIYMLLDRPIPPVLFQPLEQTDLRYKQMTAPITDGLGEDLSWEQAMTIDLGSSRGTMYENAIISRLYYGMNTHNFFVRLDWQEKPQQVDLFFFYPGKTERTSLIPMTGMPPEAPYNYRFRHHITVHKGISLFVAGEYDQWFSQQVHAQYGLIDCLEISIPWSDLGIGPGDSVSWVALAQMKDGHFIPLVSQVLDLEVPHDWQRD